MTDYPTIRIKCDPADMILAGRAAVSALNHRKVGESCTVEFGDDGDQGRFSAKRTKTGVTVRPIEGRAV